MVAMITDSERLHEVSEFAAITKLVIGHGEVDKNWPNIPYMRRFMQPRMFFDRIGNDNAAIIYSSGSTGRPRGFSFLTATWPMAPTSLLNTSVRPRKTESVVCFRSTLTTG